MFNFSRSSKFYFSLFPGTAGVILLTLALSGLFAYKSGDLTRLKNTKHCPGCDLSRANFQGLDFPGANLKNANLKRAKLRFVNLHKANLKDANLESAALQGADLRNTNLRNTVLLHAETRATDFTGAIFDVTLMPDGFRCTGSLKTCEKHLNR